MVEARLKNAPFDLFDSVDATDAILGWVDKIVRQIENEKKWTPDGKEQPTAPISAIVKVATATVALENTSELGPVLVGMHA